MNEKKNLIKNKFDLSLSLTSQTYKKIRSMNKLSYNNKRVCSRIKREESKLYKIINNLKIILRNKQLKIECFIL